MTDASASTQNGSGSYGNSSKEPHSSVPVYRVIFPGTFVEVLSNHNNTVMMTCEYRWIWLKMLQYLRKGKFFVRM